MWLIRAWVHNVGGQLLVSLTDLRPPRGQRYGLIGGHHDHISKVAFSLVVDRSDFHAQPLRLVIIGLVVSSMAYADR